MAKFEINVAKKIIDAAKDIHGKILKS